MIKKRRLLFVLIAILFLSGCYKPGPGAKPWQVSGGDGNEESLFSTATPSIPGFDEGETAPDIIVSTPTPNPPIILPTPRNETVTYTVKQGDTLRDIGRQFEVSVSQISDVNELEDPNLIEVGQVLLIPPPSLEYSAPPFKIIPDSELVYSPSNAGFDIPYFISEKSGYLAFYSEQVDEIWLSGAEIVERIAVEYSVNPRLLLAILEYQSGWVTDLYPAEETLGYPMRHYDPRRGGLYKQLAWSSNVLNEGYYRWKSNEISVWMLTDGAVMQVDPTINPGTASVVNLFGYLLNKPDWSRAISDSGVFSIYYQFFGYPFNYGFEPMIPDDFSQPPLQLPFESGDVWSYTGGPHGGWDSGSAWAALDFAPPGEPRGCYLSESWVVASAPGEIVFSDNGAVIQDLDGDGVWQTGWSLLYMHIDPWERVEVGKYLQTGDRIGHPSCEGGVSSGTHLHIARRYNGEWIAADGATPMVLDGWAAAGYGSEYNGYLIKGDLTLEARNGRSAFNAIQR